MKRGKLSDEQQTFVVQSLACFETPTDVAEAVRKEFGVEITKQSIEAYDPNKLAGKNISDKWRAIFEETRSQFLTNTSEIAVSHRAVRLRILQRMVSQTEKSKNYQLTAQLLEQAAKECGNAFSNKSRVEVGKPGDFEKMDDAELDEFIASAADVVPVLPVTKRSGRNGKRAH